LQRAREHYQKWANYNDFLDRVGFPEKYRTKNAFVVNKSAVKILLVDDEPFMLSLHARMLATMGYTSVTSFCDAQSALEAIDCATSPPDLILLDLNMPQIDGVEFVRYLVQRHYAGSLIILSGEDERMLRAAEKLVQEHQITTLGYLRKPAKREMLAAVLEKWVHTAPSEHWPQLEPGKTAETKKVYTAEEVRAAIVNGELINYYQPTVALKTGLIVGVEALVRWRHPVNGLVFPDQFITVAEQNGLIRDLTRVVIGSAFNDARRWQHEMGLTLQMAVNVSMDDLGSLEFADYIAGEAIAAGIPSKGVTLEVTESQLMQDQRTALDVLTRLRLKRFRTSIDDFGTGHSSLAQLRDLPFDELKIDRGFVHRAWADTTVMAIFNASVLLAKQLNMQIVAEGVEDRADWNFVRRSDCDVAQGYFIAKPMPAENVRAGIDDWLERELLITQKMPIV
jgi:EAL domain-containing protein (putative c-di-GMP-specific phosphodiesterase class I)/CheY-like chemotaxis protein